MKVNERILWLSRHALTEEQKETLLIERRMVHWPSAVQVEFIHLNITLPAFSGDAVQGILDLREDKGADVVSGVLPAHVAAQWMQMEVKVPLYLPVSIPAPAVEGETRGGGFVFSHWEAF